MFNLKLSFALSLLLALFVCLPTHSNAELRSPNVDIMPDADLASADNSEGRRRFNALIADHEVLKHDASSSFDDFTADDSTAEQHRLNAAGGGKTQSTRRGRKVNVLLVNGAEAPTQHRDRFLRETRLAARVKLQRRGWHPEIIAKHPSMTGVSDEELRQNPIQVSFFSTSRLKYFACFSLPCVFCSCREISVLPLGTGLTQCSPTAGRGRYEFIDILDEFLH
jgi:hypothetical protein